MDFMVGGFQSLRCLVDP